MPGGVYSALRDQFRTEPQPAPAEWEPGPGDVHDEPPGDPPGSEWTRQETTRYEAPCPCHEVMCWWETLRWQWSRNAARSYTQVTIECPLPIPRASPFDQALDATFGPGASARHKQARAV